MTQSEDLLDVLHEEVTHAVSRFGVTPAQAADIALSIESGLRHRIGGRKHYLSAADNGCKRHLIACDIEEGIKPQVIAKRRGVSLRWVYRIKRELSDSNTI